MTVARVMSVHAGSVRTLADGATRSAIVKPAVAGPAEVADLGLPGDQHADPTVHGGSEKAVHHYPGEHYAVWRRAFPEFAPLFEPGNVGENLSSSGLTEADISLGDIYRAGGVTLQVSWPRRPCRKLALRFGNPAMVRAVLETGRSGWYCRVLEPGRLAAGDEIEVLERPYEAWTVARLNGHFAGVPITPAALAELASLDGLAAAHRAWAERTLQDVEAQLTPGR